MESIEIQQVNERQGTEEPERRDESSARRALPRPPGRALRSTRDIARSERLLALFSPLALLVLWEVASRAGWLNAFFFPPPTAVLGALKRLTLSGDLPRDVLATTRRVALGFAFAAVPAAALGLVMGLSGALRAALLPIASLIYAIPKIAVLPLFLVIFGLGEQSKVAMIVASSFFFVLLNAMAGVMAIDRLHLDVAQSFGATRWQVIRTVALPGALPFVLTGARLALGFSLIVAVGSEFVIPGGYGIGTRIWLSWQILDIEQMYAGLIAAALLGVLLNFLMDEAERRLLPYRR
jgi:ABC-type nitrate/sulfonate/bicarbonate transport system permease component